MSRITRKTKSLSRIMIPDALNHFSFDVKSSIDKQNLLKSARKYETLFCYKTTHVYRLKLEPSESN